MNSDIKQSQCWLKENCNKIDCNLFCVKFFKLNYLYEKAFISFSQRKHIALRIDNDKKDAEAFSKLKQIETSISSFVNEGKNLFIHSQVSGNGKSSWSLRLVEAYFNNIWAQTPLECRALFINVPRFLLALKDNITQQSEYIESIKNNIFNADLVVWDDIGTKVITPFESEHLLSMIDTRINNGKSNIYTSNLSEEEMHQCLGDRLTSRIVNKSIDIVLYGADKRGL